MPKNPRGYLVKLLLSIRLLTVACLVASIHAQVDEGKNKKQADGVIDASSQSVSPLDGLRRASSEARPKALIVFLEDQLSTRSLYAGQYGGLRKVKGIEELVHQWIKKAPDGVEKPIIIRRACIRAMRDLHDIEAPSEVIKTLQGIAVDVKADKRIGDAAKYALAQFGFREFVGQLMIKFYTQVASKDSGDQAKGFNGLANVYYQIRDYKRAVGAYTGYLELYESGDAQIKNPQTIYYNTACCMALGGMIDESLDMMGKALKSGVGLGRRMLEEDQDIRALRKDPRFGKMLEDYFGKKK